MILASQMSIIAVCLMFASADNGLVLFFTQPLLERIYAIIMTAFGMLFTFLGALDVLFSMFERLHRTRR
jgi:hypothetical protein